MLKYANNFGSNSIQTRKNATFGTIDRAVLSLNRMGDRLISHEWTFSVDNNFIIHQSLCGN